MRVLIISQFYKPEPLPQPHELAASLVRLGHDVTVLTGYPNYPEGRLYPGYRLRPWRQEVDEGVRIVRVPLWPDHSRSALRRALNYGSFAVMATLHAPLIALRRPDVAYVWHPPPTSALAAWLLSLLRGVPYLYAIHDLWPESITEAGMLKDGPAASLIRWLDTRMCLRAGAVGVVSPGFVPFLTRRGVPRDKIHLLPDWADEASFYPLERDESLASELGMSGRFNVVFGGQLGIAQGLDTLLDAAELLREAPEVQVVFAGDGVEGPRLRAEARRRGLDNVRFLGRISADMMNRVQSLAEVLVVHLNRGFFASVSIPVKTYAYMASGRPILMALDGHAADLILEAGAGMTCPPQEAEPMADAILRLRALRPEERGEMGRNALLAFRERHSRSTGVAAHERILSDLANREQR